MRNKNFDKKSKKLRFMIKKFFIFWLLLSSSYVYSQDLQLVRNASGKYGFVDLEGDTIIECKFDYAENFSGGLALVKNNLRYKLIDTSGKLVDLADYDGSQRFRHDMGEYHSGLPVLVKQWDISYISSSGEVYLSVPYQDATSFSGGKAKVFDGDKYNYISKNGLLLGAWQETEDDYHAIKNKDKFGYIDKNGRLVLDYQFINAKDFYKGYAQISNGNYWALIDVKGQRLSDWYEEIEPFKGELAIVHKLGNVGFINRSGKFMGQWYKDIEPLDYGMYKVSKYEKYGLVNSEGFLVSQWFDNIYSFKNGYLKVEKEDKYAYVNKIGGMVIGWYDKVGDVVDGIVQIEDEGKYGFFNVESFYISELFDYLGDFHDGLAVVKKGDKYGYVDKKGNFVFNLIYENASDFDAGIAQVVKDGKSAYVDVNGNIILGWLESKKYFYKEPPRGLIVVKMGTKYGFQTINGRRVISAKFDYAENFSDGLALVKNKPREMLIDKEGNLKPLTAYPDDKNIRLDLGYGHSGKPVKVTVWDCAFIDYEGDIVLKLDDITDARSFSNGKAMVIKGDKYNYIDTKGKFVGKWTEFPDDYHADFKNGRFGFVDKNGNVVIDYKFNDANDFKNGKAKVRLGNRTNGKYGYINRKGEFITKMYDDVTDFENNVAIVRSGEKYAIIDTAGVEISKWYDKIGEFSEGFAKVSLNGKYSFISLKGKQFDKWFDDAGNFVGGRAKIKLNNLWGFVDKKGSIAVRADYDAVWNFANNIAKVQKDGKYAFIDLNGKVITDWYDRIFMFSDERAVICKDNKWGYIDINGRIVIKPVYQRAFAFSNGEAMVVSNGKMMKIDKEGNFIDEEKANN